MTTIKLAVLKHTKSKDGSYKIRISIGHKSETHYIVTKYKVNSLSNFVNGVVVGQPDAKAVNIKLRQLLNEYDERLEHIPNAGEMSCEELRNLLRDMPAYNQTTTFQQVADRYIGMVDEEGRASTAKLMRYHVKRFLTFTNGDIFLTHITPRLIDDYIHHLKQGKLSAAYIQISLSPVRTLLNYAVKMQFVKYDVPPFAFTQVTQAPPRDVDLSVDDMRKLFSYTPPKRASQKVLDLFMLSYMLGGMNMKDMLAYDFRQGDTLSYIRKKTEYKNVLHRHTTFTIPAEAKPIIARWMNKETGLLDVCGNNKYDSFMTVVSRSIKITAKNAGVQKENICFYSARKSFVQHGFDLGISLEVLEYCIGQSMKSNRPIFNYAKVMSKHADDAIRKILDNLLGKS